MGQQTSGLLAVLKDELKYERESYRKDDVLLEAPPNGFQLQETAGRCVFYLTKEYKGEKIQVQCSIDPQLGDEDEGDEDDGGDEEDSDGSGIEGGAEPGMSVPAEFQVTIVKESSSVTFECEATSDFVQVKHISFQSAEDVNEEGESLGDEAYTGPLFDELDETLQQAFMYYLEERGVDTELGQYLQLLTMDKRSLEYQTWLSRLKDFVQM